MAFEQSRKATKRMSGKRDDVLSKLVSSRTRGNRSQPDVEQSVDDPVEVIETSDSATKGQDSTESKNDGEGAVGAQVGQVDSVSAVPADDASVDELGALWGQRRVVVDNQSVDVAAMAEYDWASPPHEPHEVFFDRRSVGDGQWLLSLTWPEPDETAGEVSVFRVIAGDGEPPDSDCNDVDSTVAVGNEANALDGTTNAVPLAPVRYYEVWRYRGKTVLDAVRRPPYLYAQGHYIWPPVGCGGDVDHGQVTISWEPPGDDDSSVYRWLRLSRREAMNQAHRPGPEEANEASTGGFVDPDAQSGEKYVYLIFSGAEIDGDIEWGEQPHRVTIKVPEVLTPVMDLQVERDPERDGVVHLSWTTVSSGKVVIYRASQAPRDEIHEAGEVPLEALETPEYGLQSGDAIARHPTQRDGSGRTLMRNVPLPEGEAEVHFTPVTQASGRGVPGRAIGLLRLSPPKSPFLEDRVDWVLIVFEWPKGAEQVNVYATAAAVDLDPTAATPVEVMRKDEHEEYGGFRVPRAKFAPGPCTVHLVGQTRHAGSVVYSAAVTLEHAFPVLVYYSLAIKRGIGGKPKVTLDVWGPTSADGIRMALAWRSDSLPLSEIDAELARPLCLTPPLGVRPQRTTVDLTPGLTGEVPTSGFLRMLTAPDANVALVDPPLDQLRLG